MSERKAAYIVGNIYRVDFGQFKSQLDGDSHAILTYGVQHPTEYTKATSLKADVNALYMEARDEQKV